jgi:phage antirepressor YoqD-like protein
MTSTTFQDNQNLSDNSGSSLTQFLNQDGSEFVINTTSGDAFISQSAAARVLDINERTVRRCKEDGLFTVETAVVNTPTGKRSSALISAEDFFILAQKYKPVVAKQMLKAGANLYIYGLVGYKISISEPTQPAPTPFQIPTTLSEALFLAGELAEKVDTLEAQIEADSEATALGQYINKGEGLIGMSEMARILETGRSRYLSELRECGIIMKGKVTPYQCWLERKLFKVTETLNAKNEIIMVTLITPKGQLYLAKRHKQFLANEWMIVRVERELNLV